MTVKQISQISHRHGRTDEIPRSLEEFEIGFGEDTGNMFVGTPNLPQTQGRDSFPYQNTEILTEWSQNVEKLLRHLYQNRDNSNIDPLGQPQPTAVVRDNLGNQPYRPLQETLDERMSVKMFGAKGNASRDLDNITKTQEELVAETFALRNAIIHASNNLNFESESGHYRPQTLYFPAGVYVINDPLFIPPNAHWVGDGKDNTIIVMIDPQKSCVAHTVDGFFSPEKIDALRAGDIGVIDQHSRYNISSDYLPQDGKISGIKFVHVAGNQDILQLHRAKNYIFENCAFEGGYDIGDKPNHTWYDYRTDGIALAIDTLGSVIETGNIVLQGCTIDHCTYGILVTSDTHKIVVSNSHFTNLYRGVSVGEDIVNDNGYEVLSYPPSYNCPPVGCGDLPKTAERAGNLLSLGVNGPGDIKVSHSCFERIQMEGFAVYRNNPMAGNSSNFNNYKYVGEDWQDEQSGSAVFTSAPVFFGQCTQYNSSIGDTFSRICPPESERERRVWWYYDDPNLIVNPQDPLVWTFGINLGGGLYQSGMNTTHLPPTGPDAVAFLPNATFPTQGHDSFIIEYSLQSLTTNPLKPKRVGSMKIITDGENIEWSEDYTSLNGRESDIIFDIRHRDNRIEVLYGNNSGVDYEFRWSAKSWNTGSTIFGPGYGGVYGINPKCGDKTGPCNPGPCSDPCE